MGSIYPLFACMDGLLDPNEKQVVGWYFTGFMGVCAIAKLLSAFLDTVT